MANEFYPDWKIVPYDLNKKPKEDPHAYALVPANTEQQLAAMPSCQRSSTQSYYTNQFSPCRRRPSSQGAISQAGGDRQGASRHEGPAAQAQ